MQGNLTVLDFQFRAIDTEFWILCQWISNYEWDPEYLTFIPDSKRKFPGFRIPLHWATVILR